MEIQPRTPEEMQAEIEDLKRRLALTSALEAELARILETLQLDERLIQVLMEYSPDNIYFKDRQNRFIRVSRAQARYFKQETPEDLIGKTDFDFFSNSYAVKAFADEQKIIQTGEPILNIEEMQSWPDGRVTWCSTTKAPLLDEEGRIIGTFGISRDITERMQALDELRESEIQNRRITGELSRAYESMAEANTALENLTLTDPLTNLKNRRYLMAAMPEDIAQVKRLQRDVAEGNVERMKVNVDVVFAMIDIDFFKHVNDLYGHNAGDTVLKQFSQILAKSVRDSDTVARWGGEEFVVVGRNSSRVDAQVLPERIRSAVEAHPFDIGEGRIIHCTCSIGFSVFPFLTKHMDLYSWEQIIELADQCLYVAKRNGRNAWVGMIPISKRFDGIIADELPQDLSELLKSNLFPVISSSQELAKQYWNSRMSGKSGLRVRNFTIQEKETIREIIHGACTQGGLMILSTSSECVEAHFVHLDSDNLQVVASLNQEDACTHVSTEVWMRFPHGYAFLEGPTSILKIEDAQNKRTLRLSIPKHLKILGEDGTRRAAYRVDRVGHIQVAFSTQHSKSASGTLVNISVSGARIQSLQDFHDGELLVDDTISLSVPLSETIHIETNAKVRYLKDRNIGLEFRPSLEGDLLQVLSRWAFLKREESLKELSPQTSNDMVANEPSEHSEMGGLLLVSSIPMLEDRLSGLLVGLPPLRRVHPDNLNEAMAQDPELVIIHVEDTQQGDRKRIKSLLKFLGESCPYVLLGTGEMILSELIEFGKDVKAVDVHVLSPIRETLFPRFIQGILRHPHRT